VAARVKPSASFRVEVRSGNFVVQNGQAVRAKLRELASEWFAKEGLHDIRRRGGKGKTELLPKE